MPHPAARPAARRLRALTPIAVIAFVAGCASATSGHPVAGTGSSASAAGGLSSAGSATNPPTVPITPPSVTTPPAPPATASAPGPPSATQAAGVVCTEPATRRTTQCLEGALATFWSGQLNMAVAEPAVLAPARADVPAACRTALDVAPAFTCHVNATLYFSSGFLALIRKTFVGGDRTYALASVQAHEMGHIVQYAVHQPQLERTRPTDAQSRFVEQQADCLSGVWAAQADGTGGFDAARFHDVATRLIALISTNPEIRTHGTPPQRSAAIERGIRGGRPQSCRLATFH